MIIVTVTTTPKPEHRQPYIDHMVSLAETVRTEDGCFTYTLYTDPADPARLFLYEEWENRAALDAHMGQPHMAAHREKISGWFSRPTVIRIHEAEVAEVMEV